MGGLSVARGRRGVRPGSGSGLRLALGIAAMLAIALGPAAPAAAAADVATFGSPTVEGAFGQDITFRQPVTLTGPVDRAELLVTFADAIGPQVFEVPAPTGTGATVLEYIVRIADQGHILPNTPLTASWRLTPHADPSVPAIGPAVHHVYADEGHDWKTTTGKIVRVHWYEGSDAFGKRALEIGESAMEASAAQLGVTETDPVDFFIYADQAAFRAALGPGTRENVGGQADAEIRTLFALIPAAQIDDAWVKAVVPHELTHLVFDAAAENPYHFPPRWLNEGVAVYESEGYGASDRSDVAKAARNGSLVPLPGLTGQFPTSGDGFRLAYSESVSAVDYLIRTNGKDALVGLIKSYANGRTDDEAFQAATGHTMAGFSDAWLGDNDAKAPVKAGPRPAPAGPLPSGWTGPLPSAQARGTPAAGASTPPEAIASASPTGATGATTAASSGAIGAVAIVVALSAVLVAAGIVVARRRRGDAA